MVPRLPIRMALNSAQRKSLATGFGLILVVAAIIVLIWLGTYLPGLPGEIFSMIAGIMWSPVLLDLSLFLIGLTLVLWVNHIRRKGDGDEFVYLEAVEGPDIPDDLSAESRSAIFRHRPEEPDRSIALAAVEGALDMGDLQTATELLLEVPEEELDLPDTLALRIRLAELNGDENSARRLRKKRKTP